MSMHEETIWVVTSDSLQFSDIERGYRETSQQHNTKFSVSDLEQKMSQFLHAVNCIFRQVEQQKVHTSGMSLEEIELSVEISSEGEIKLMGTGGKAGGKGAIKLKFKRLKNKP